MKAKSYYSSAEDHMLRKRIGFRSRVQTWIFYSQDLTSKYNHYVRLTLFTEKSYDIVGIIKKEIS